MSDVEQLDPVLLDRARRQQALPIVALAIARANHADRLRPKLDRPPVRIDIHDLRHEIRVAGVARGEQLDEHLADDEQGVRQRRRGVDQDVGPSLEMALVDAIRSLEKEGLKFTASPIKDSVAAVSVGIVRGEPMLDLNYQEDSKADVDMNVVLTGKGLIVELQGTAEKTPFDFARLTTMHKLAEKGIGELRELQKKALAT